MLRAALTIAIKDLRLVAGRGSSLLQAMLLGLLLIFVFSLSQGIGEIMGAQSSSAIFWLSSIFCQVLVFNSLYSLEESNGQRQALLLAPIPVQGIWLGKALSGFILLLLAQFIFLPAIVVFLDKTLHGSFLSGLGIMLLTDVGIIAVGSLLGALSQGQAGKESLLSIIIFPLLIPILLAGIRLGASIFSGVLSDDYDSWLGIIIAFDAMFSAAGLVLFGFLYNGED